MLVMPKKPNVDCRLNVASKKVQLLIASGRKSATFWLFSYFYVNESAKNAKLSFSLWKKLLRMTSWSTWLYLLILLAKQQSLDTKRLIFLNEIVNCWSVFSFSKCDCCYIFGTKCWMRQQHFIAFWLRQSLFCWFFSKFYF